MIHTGKIPTENIQDIQLEVFSYLNTHGYPVDEIVEAYSVTSMKKDPQKDDTGHIVLQVQTLSKPMGEADAVADRTTEWVCDCKDYQFNKSIDLESRALAEWDSCKHIKEVSKSEKAVADERQSQLG
jgi:hypothetical protein